MAISTLHRTTFRNGSRTYHSSTRFFPAAVREDVYALYGFVRVADDFVDAVPQNRDGFYRFRDRYRGALVRGGDGSDPIIDAFVALSIRRGFDPRWTEAFLDSMEQDLFVSSYDTLDATLRYIYGSAEVIGLFMARIMNLSDESLPAAAMLGRAMQYINFIRDIQEDLSLGRRYLPLGDACLESLEEEHTRTRPEEFVAFIRTNIARYRKWQQEAERGFHYIPRSMRIAIKTASDMYRWTADTIEDDPFIVYRRKVKPKKGRILMTGMANLFGV